jgi:transcriptional repressor NrdR
VQCRRQSNFRQSLNHGQIVGDLHPPAAEAASEYHAEGPVYGPGSPSVQCPFCGRDDDKVIDSRSSEAGRVIRRRRECAGCQRRFTTYERVEQTHRLMVAKRDGTRQPFNRDNIMRSVQAACGKRRVTEEAIARMVDSVEDELHREYDREVPSNIVGERVMRKLRDLDEVAWVRFASEYFKFKSVDELRQQLELLEGRVRDVKDQTRLFE